MSAHSACRVESSQRELRTRSSLVLLSHLSWPKSLTWVLARGMAYQPSVALVISVLYQLYYMALDPVLGVSALLPMTLSEVAFGSNQIVAPCPLCVYPPPPFDLHMDQSRVKWTMR